MNCVRAHPGAARGAWGTALCARPPSPSACAPGRRAPGVSGAKAPPVLYKLTRWAQDTDLDGAVVGGCGRGCGQRRGHSDRLGQARREESVVEADCQLVQESALRPGAQARAWAAAAGLLLDDGDGEGSWVLSCAAFWWAVDAVPAAQGCARRAGGAGWCPRGGWGRSSRTRVAVLPTPLLPLLARVGMHTRAVACCCRRSIIEVRVMAEELMEQCIRLLVNTVVPAWGAAGPGTRAAGSGGHLWHGPLEAAAYGGLVARAREGGAFLWRAGRPLITRTAALDAGVAAVHLQQLAGPTCLALRWARCGWR